MSHLGLRILVQCDIDIDVLALRDIEAKDVHRLTGGQNLDTVRAGVEVEREGARGAGLPRRLAVQRNGEIGGDGTVAKHVQHQLVFRHGGVREAGQDRRRN